ncbi:glycosyl hydrolase family 16 [Colletotrichum orchidophilum]|uniref:Crh-like protein n=1 Tax=Colletotrichum orchidophilum TaxID=1209926 RepID=A0A1G4B5G7_9PEZI|nr:glycosyl hydrolase family 16 [Colletotrichum orchidophilum]OHE96543.1 glycosyl hydrolase family 16 [Colletotrichum orchidophilum]
MLSVLPMGLALLGATTVLAQTPPSCSLTQKCPESAPCCSQYGQCGTGAFCLGGCDPRMSFSLDACVPAPVCQDKKMPMNSLDKIVDISKYYGDPSKADWISQGEPALYNNEAVLLTMPVKSVGTVLATSTYLWYGSVSATIRTSRGPGVVTAFILYGDVKDEIDYEWVGADLEMSQTNYYFQGIPKYDQSGNISLSDTFNNWHTYEIEWTPDEIRWMVDGQVGRTKKRSDTWNATAQQWDYPQTPARVQLSIWPGGAATNAKGTIDWAGGPINWEHEDIKNNGYFYAMVKDVEINCYNAKSGPGTNSKKSYYYNNIKATNDTVVDSDKDTILKSFLGTGLDMNAGASSASGTAAQPTASAATIPGGSSSGTGNDHSDSGSSSSGSGSGSGSSGSGSGSGDSSGSGSGSSSGCGTNGFSQDCSSGSGSGSSKSEGFRRESSFGASAFAALVAASALFWL